MASLIYSTIASLDGYVEDAAGRFEWAAPDDEVVSFINELERPVRTYLYGRRMYETMSFWETAPLADMSDADRDWTEIWRSAEKIVYSRSLEAPSSARTRVERSFDAQQVRQLKQTASSSLTIGGADLAGQALEHGLVDELQLFTFPAVVGGGKPWLPSGLRLDLELLETRSFASGFVYLRYRPVRGE